MPCLFAKSADDQAHPPYFTGLAGYQIRKLLLPVLTSLPAIERRWPGFFFWTGKGRYEADRRSRLLAARGEAH